MPEESLRDVAARLTTSTEALAALAAGLRLKASGQEAPAEVQTCLDEVAEALGVGGALASASPDELGRALAPIRALFLQSVDLLTDPTRAPGWTYTNVELLESLGQNSAVFAEIVRDVLAPQLEGLADALARPDAAFLDVGVGVAALSIAMCRVIPGLRAVGIDPWEVALELARRNVAAAGLDDRIELRRQAVEELPDESAFELAFLAGPFLGSAVIDVGLSARARRAAPRRLGAVRDVPRSRAARDRARPPAHRPLGRRRARRPGSGAAPGEGGLRRRAHLRGRAGHPVAAGCRATCALLSVP